MLLNFFQKLQSSGTGHTNSSMCHNGQDGKLILNLWHRNVSLHLTKHSHFTQTLPSESPHELSFLQSAVFPCPPVSILCARLYAEGWHSPRLVCRLLALIITLWGSADGWLGSSCEERAASPQPPFSILALTAFRKVTIKPRLLISTASQVRCERPQDRRRKMKQRTSGSLWPHSRGTVLSLPPIPELTGGLTELSNWLDESLLELEEEYRSFWTPRSLVADLIQSLP